MKCHVCSEAFDHDDGAVCSRCRRPACTEHLRLAGYSERASVAARPDQIVCTECLRPGEAHAPFERRLFFENSWGRVLGL